MVEWIAVWLLLAFWAFIAAGSILEDPGRSPGRDEPGR